MVQMPTASSESAPVRLFPFLSSSSSSFFLIAVVVVVLQRARGFVFFGEKRARGVKIFVPPPRAGGFPFFSLSSLSLSLSLCGGISGARVRWSFSSSSSLSLVLVQRWPFPRFILLNNSCFRDATSNRAQQQQQLEALAETPSPSWTKNSVETRSWRPSPTRTASRRR